MRREGISIFPKIGTKCHIKLLNCKNWEKEQLKARLADVTHDEYFMELPIPDNRNAVYIPKKGHLWRVFYMSDSRSAMFQFDTTVVDVVHSNIHLVRVRRPHSEDVNKIQRREFLRVPIQLNVTLEKEAGGYQLHGITLDISGGGMAVSCHPKTAIRQGERLKGALALPSEEKGEQSVTEVPFSVEVMRVEHSQADGERTVCYCKFIYLKPKHQSAIIRLCYKRQRELYEKGLK